jgi:hypothetical protein
MRDIDRFVEENYRTELENPGEFFYVWQYGLAMGW